MRSYSLKRSNYTTHTLLGCGVALAASIMGSAAARGASITAITSDQVPVSNPSSVFDASNTGNIYSLESGTQFIPAGFDVRDLFGGSFGTFGPEQHDVIFDNYQPIGTIESVDVLLSSPVVLNSFSLFLQEDSNGDRSASEFRIFSDDTLIDDIPILDNSGTQSYAGQYGSTDIEVSDALNGLTASSFYTLELIQNHNANFSSGIRAMDFQATGTATTGTVSASVPEPASVTGVVAGFAALSRRLRRIRPV